jgi:uncharacterized protein YqeY
MMSDEWQGIVQAIVNDAERSPQYLIPNTQSKIPRLRLSYGGRSNTKYLIPNIKLFTMSLEQKIMTDLKAAMIAKDEAALRSLRAVKAAILLAKTSEGGSGELKEEEEVKILQKLVKQRKDSLEIFKQQNREDLAKKEEEEIAVIEKFLPKQMTAEELKTEIAAIIANVGASSPADMGKVMGVASKQFAGKADGKTISAVVKELLSR